MKEFQITCFSDPITVREGVPEDENALGSFNEKTGEMLIHPNQPEEGKHIILIHELLHLVDAMLVQAGVSEKRVNHKFITTAAPGLLMALVSSGFYTGISLEGLLKFIEAEGQKENE